ncbi:MAG: putative PEP-binding protein, partial [Myxococcota bacterium]
GAEGVGLYRTEFLYINQQRPPEEDEQLATFQRVLNVMDGQPVTLRTFDIGGDKFVTTFRMPDELNPMLGLRAVRLALAEPELFRVHLRAMVRASAFGEVKIMIPLVARLDELRRSKEFVEQAIADVRAAGHACAETIPVGVMIEVPAAAMMADRFAEEADFMSIGTNDLVQYALAVDRTNRTLAHLASPYDPAILRLIDNVIQAGTQHDCPVSVCGEMASDPYGALLLAGMGVREMSMESVAIPEIKESMRRVTLGELERIADLARRSGTAVEVEDLLSDTLEPRLTDILTGQPESVAPGPRSRPSSSRRGLSSDRGAYPISSRPGSSRGPQQKSPLPPSFGAVPGVSQVSSRIAIRESLGSPKLPDLSAKPAPEDRGLDDGTD